jgi:hypothetical protein
MSFRSFRTRWAALPVVALACATATSAAPLTATLVDPQNAPAAVSSCTIDYDSSGVFTPAVTIADRKPAALTSADVGIDFFDAQNRLLGHVVVAPPYGPTGTPFGSIDRVACRIERAEFADGSRYAPYDRPGGNAIVPVAGAILGVGAAAALAGSSHSNSSSGSSSTVAPTATPGSGSATPTPVPVASIVPLAQRRKIAPALPPFLPPTPLPVRR